MKEKNSSIPFVLNSLDYSPESTLLSKKVLEIAQICIVGFFLDGFFSLQDVIYFFSLRADLEDYFKCMT